MTDHSGVLKDLVDGSWRDPDSGSQYDIGIESILIRESLDGAVKTTRMPHAALKERFGCQTSDSMIEQTKIKALTEKCAAKLDHRFDEDWENIRSTLGSVMLPFE